MKSLLKLPNEARLPAAHSWDKHLNDKMCVRARFYRQTGCFCHISMQANWRLP